MALNKVKIYDTLMNFIVLTPLVLAFWQGTNFIIDDLISRYLHSSGVMPGIMLLVIGAGIEFIITYWQSGIISQSNKFSRLGYILFSRVYNYVVAIGNVCHLRAIEPTKPSFMDVQNHNHSDKIIYKNAATNIGYKTGDGVADKITATTALVILMSFRACRNIVAIPYIVTLDPTGVSSEYFSAQTLLHTAPSEGLKHFIDVQLTVLGVWSLQPLVWISVSQSFEAIMPHGCSHSIIVGYLGTVLCWMLRGKFQDLISKIDRNYGHTCRVFTENLYLTTATAFSILSWNGIDQFITMVTIKSGHSLKSIGYNILPWIALSLLQASRSLVGKGCELDGAMTPGDGINHPASYFHEDSKKEHNQ